MYFFDDPNIIFKTYPNASILITPHNFSEGLQHLDLHGIYNVSFQSFKNDANGLACLRDWSEKCFNWCHDHFDAENDRFADQKYLDAWHSKFNGVEAITLSGTGLALWNIERHTYTLNANNVLVDGRPLIYYHFHQLRVFNTNFAFNGLELYHVQTDRKAIRLVYHAYLKKIRSFSGKQGAFDKNIARGIETSGQKLTDKLQNPYGYWFFTEHLIMHVNLYKWYNKLKRKLKIAWPG